MKRLLICLIALMLVTLPALADKDDTFELTLKGNPTTGYEWLYKVEDETLLTVVDNGYQQDAEAEGLVGAGGKYSFLLKGLKDGKTTVTFTYARSWETEEAPLCTVVYTVETDDDGDVTVYACEINPGL